MSQRPTAQRLRAPREDRAILAEPPLAAIGPVVDANQRLFEQKTAFLGRSWCDLRRDARRNLLDAAASYFQENGEPVPVVSGEHLFLAGHQPELFHPGVWVKNFALRGLAKKLGAASVNLVVDNDYAKSTMLHVPAGTHRAAVPFDRRHGDVPFEERGVLDEELFAGLWERVQPLVASWPYEPLLRTFWPDVLDQRTPLLGERLAAARRLWERRFGCHQLEVPLSRLCQSEPFAWFACHLLEELPRFHGIYNRAVHEYRQAHGIRSKFHPVPDLAMEGDWLEAPFWAWQAGQGRRDRLFARLSADRLWLRMGKEVWSLPRPGQAPEQAVAAWRNLAEPGVKVRTRALTTTMYARLLVGDLFVHGIGGGKYDELTDVIMQRFHGVRPPHYLVLSATLFLPLPALAISQEDMYKLAHDKRDLWWNPQRHLAGGDGMDAFREEKNVWIGREGENHRERVERFVKLRKITDEMRQFIAPDFERMRNRLTQWQHEWKVSQVLRRRDYAFCLYPEKELGEFMRGFLEPN